MLRTFPRLRIHSIFVHNRKHHTYGVLWHKLLILELLNL